MMNLLAKGWALAVKVFILHIVQGVKREASKSGVVLKLRLKRRFRVFGPLKLETANPSSSY